MYSSRRQSLCVKSSVIAFFLLFALFFSFYKMKSIDRFINIVYLEQDSVAIETLTAHTQVDRDNISCHYSTEGDALPSAEAAGFAPAPRSIFFHETSCRGGLNSRQACAVESAARAHPHRQVHVLFSAPVTQHVLETSCLSKLRQLHNINFLRVHADEYSKGTPVESTLAKVAEQSVYPMEHSSDILRIVTLYKWGGVYLDGDVIVLRSFESLPLNWIARESKANVASGIMSFTKDDSGQSFTKAVLEELLNTYQPTSWSYNGPLAILRVFKRMCPDVIKSNLMNCNGIRIFGREQFYPIYYTESSEYFVPGDVDMDGPYTHHVWNKLTRDSKVTPDSRYAKLAKRFCPTIYEEFGDMFGV